MGLSDQASREQRGGGETVQLPARKADSARMRGP